MVPLETRDYWRLVLFCRSCDGSGKSDANVSELSHISRGSPIYLCAGYERLDAFRAWAPRKSRGVSTPWTRYRSAL